MADLYVNALGTLVLLVTATGVFYANSLKSALAGSELADVWKYIGLGIVFLFLGAILGGGATLIGMDSLTAMLVTTLLASIFLTLGIKMQLDKVK